MRIYVSSTYVDLIKFREQVRLAIRRMGHEDVAMEYYVAGDERPLDRCLADVRSCDMYVCVVAWRYGWIPPGQDHSITELEWRTAVAADKPRLGFLLLDKAPWPMDQVEMDAFQQVKAFRASIAEDRLAGWFTDESELARLVNEGIVTWQRERGIQPSGLATDWSEYRNAVHDVHQFVRLQVIAGAKRDVAPIPLLEVFVPSMARRGRPDYDVPEPAESDLPDVEAPATALEVEPLAAVPERSTDVIGRERTQVFLGIAGSGKSTILHAALLRLSAPEQGGVEDAHQPVPFLVELRDYVVSGAADFIGYIVRSAAARYGVEVRAEDVTGLLGRDGGAWLLFDGVDEIFRADDRQRVVRQIVGFARAHPLVQVVVTSRIAGFDGTELAHAGFQQYTLLSFGLNEIRQFVPRWYQYYTLPDDLRDPRGLVGRIENSPRLRELAGNPLLLTMMAVIYRDRDLPERRAELYARASDVLLEDWEVKRKNIQLDTLEGIHIRKEQKAELLQRVAMAMLTADSAGRELNAIARAPLLRIFADYLIEKYDQSRGDAEAIADSILDHLRERTYVLAEIADNTFGFVHRTFMEYFAARHYKAEFAARKADYDWLSGQVFGPNWSRQEMEEVLLLLTAMLSAEHFPVRDVVDHLRTRCRVPDSSNVLFAARALAEAGPEEEAWARQVLTELTTAICDVWVPQRRRAGTEARLQLALAAFSSLTAQVAVPDEVVRRVRALRASYQPSIRLVGWQMEASLRPRSERLQFALSALQDSSELIRRAAIGALEREWPGRPNVGAALIEVLRSDANWKVRQAAIAALKRTWPDVDDVLDVIEKRIETEQSFTLALWLIDYLGQRWGGSPRALRLIGRLATRALDLYGYGDEDDRVLKAVVGAVGSGWGPSAALEGFSEWAVEEHPGLRAIAAAAAARTWPDAHETKDLVLGRFRHDDDERVSAVALTAACEMGDDAGRSLAGDAASTDPRPLVRMTALGELAERWPDSTDTLDRLRARSQQDADDDVRIVAIYLLLGIEMYRGTLIGGRRYREQTRWRNLPDTLSVVEGLAATESPTVRQAALLAMARTLPSRQRVFGVVLEVLPEAYSFVRMAGEFQVPWAGHYYFTGVAFNPIGGPEHPDPGSGWLHDRAVYDLYRTRAVDDPDPAVRFLAASILAWVWPTRPDVDALLHDRAAHDPDAGVRQGITDVLNRK